MNHEPDNFEKGIRFGCGAVLGFLIGLYLMLDLLVSESVFYAIVTIFAMGCICGFFAMKKGDRFWFLMKDWFFNKIYRN